MQPTPLQQSIQRTLAYFDMFNFPLTKEELFRYLWQAPSTLTYDRFTAELEAEAAVEKTYGYYHLPGKAAIVETRRRSTLVSDRKLKRARLAAWLLHSVPFLKAIFVSSSVAAETAYPQSDIDFFIIAAPARVWIVRLFANLILRTLGLRVYGKKRKNRMCLCFFVDTNHLNLEPYRIEKDDIHFMYWLSSMLPVYDEKNYFGDFIKANKWVGNYLPNIQLSSKAQPTAGHLKLQRWRRDPSTSLRFARNDSGKVGKWWKKMWEAMWAGAYGDTVEKQAKEVQYMKMKLSLKEKAKLGNNEVVIADGILKLHDNDRRKFYRDKWIQSL